MTGKAGKSKAVERALYGEADSMLRRSSLILLFFLSACAPPPGPTSSGAGVESGPRRLLPARAKVIPIPEGVPIISLDVALLSRTPVFARFRTQLEGWGSQHPTVRAIDRCYPRLVARLGRLFYAASAENEKTAILMATGSFDSLRMIDCVAKNTGLGRTRVARLPALAGRLEGRRVLIVALARGTLVAAWGPFTEATRDVLLGRRPGLRSTPHWASHDGARFRPRPVLVITWPALGRKKLPGMMSVLGEARSLTARIALPNRGFDLKARLVMGDDRSAAKIRRLVPMLKGFLRRGAAKVLVDRLRVGGKGPVIEVTAALNERDFRRIWPLIPKLIPGRKQSAAPPPPGGSKKNP